MTPVTRRRADNRFYDRPGQGACWRCKTARVATPRATRADGMPQDRAMFCDACIDRCHEATDFAHVCQICASPEEARYYGWAVRA